MHVYTGCRTTKERQARGKGIACYDFDSRTGTLKLRFAFEGLTNPSYLTLNQAGDRLYTVHGDTTSISSFIRDPETGALALLNRQDTQGKNPVHLQLSPDERWLLVSNHIGASLAVLPVETDGSLGAVRQLVNLKGSPGPHRIEQPHAKPHFNPLSPDGRYVVVPDKGLDCVFVLPFRNGYLNQEKAKKIPAREGSGPRHLVFHPNGKYAYCINELDCTVTFYHWTAACGSLKPAQIISTLPQDFTGNSRAAAIIISRDGRNLYASNRGHDSISHFHIHPRTGWLEFVESHSTRGKTPRFICLSPDNRFLFALNEDSHSIQVFSVNPGTNNHCPHSGVLTPLPRQTPTGSPVCMVFA